MCCECVEMGKKKEITEAISFLGRFDNPFDLIIALPEYHLSKFSFRKGADHVLNLCRFFHNYLSNNAFSRISPSDPVGGIIPNKKASVGAMSTTSPPA